MQAVVVLVLLTKSPGRVTPSALSSANFKLSAHYLGIEAGSSLVSVSQISGLTSTYLETIHEVLT